MLLDWCDEEIIGRRNNKKWTKRDNNHLWIRYCEREKTAEVERKNDNWNYNWEPLERDHKEDFPLYVVSRNPILNKNPQNIYFLGARWVLLMWMINGQIRKQTFPL